MHRQAAAMPCHAWTTAMHEPHDEATAHSSQRQPRVAAPTFGCARASDAPLASAPGKHASPRNAMTRDVAAQQQPTMPPPCLMAMGHACPEQSERQGFKSEAAGGHASSWNEMECTGRWEGSTYSVTSPDSQWPSVLDGLVDLVRQGMACAEVGGGAASTLPMSCNAAAGSH